MAMKRYLLLIFFLVLSGCAARSTYDWSRVSDEIRTRTGHGLRPGSSSLKTDTPAGVVLEDGLTGDEAVAIALWNNARFQADLAELGFARADLRDSGLLRNPVLTFLFPLDQKQLETTMNLIYRMMM